MSADSTTEAPAATPAADATTPEGDVKGNAYWRSLRLPPYKHEHEPVQNAQEVYTSKLSTLDRLAVKVTDWVGSVGFFLIILAWTVVWCGYNILASELPGLGWKAFDPFPAFVAYLLISNVIQILLMPLIMVGQNLQSRYADTRSALDFEINKKAEQEIAIVLRHLEHNTDLLIQLMKHLECRVDDTDLRVLATERKITEHILAADPEGAAAAA